MMRVIWPAVSSVVAAALISVALPSGALAIGQYGYSAGQCNGVKQSEESDFVIAHAECLKKGNGKTCDYEDKNVCRDLQRINAKCGGLSSYLKGHLAEVKKNPATPCPM
jgi:hypothetical protein